MIDTADGNQFDTDAGSAREAALRTCSDPRPPRPTDPDNQAANLRTYLASTPYTVESRNVQGRPKRYRFGVARGERSDWFSMKTLATVSGFDTARELARALRAGFKVGQADTRMAQAAAER